MPKRRKILILLWFPCVLMGMIGVQIATGDFSRTYLVIVLTFFAISEMMWIWILSRVPNE